MFSYLNLSVVSLLSLLYSIAHGTFAPPSNRTPTRKSHNTACPSPSPVPHHDRGNGFGMKEIIIIIIIRARRHTKSMRRSCRDNTLYAYKIILCALQVILPKENGHERTINILWKQYYISQYSMAIIPR